jgi:sialic acid synthase SpsE/sugar phosphate isomerase/epimerase
LIISNNIHEYSFSKDLSIKLALEQLERTGLQILFLVDSKGLVSGVVTDGDVRRWMLSRSTIDLSQPIRIVAPSEFVSARQGKRVSELNSVLTKGKTRIPLVDAGGILVGVLSEKTDVIAIGEKSVGPQYPVYVIAEIGNNHQGSLDTAKALIEMAASAGVDSVKFQMRSMDSLYGENAKDESDSLDLGAQYTAELLSKYQLTDDELFQAFDHCKHHGVEPICTPWDLESLKKLKSYGLAAYKVASADFTNHELLVEIAKTNSPMICSTGMCSEAEIKESTGLLKDLGAQTILLHCNSTYPTPFKDVNLSYLPVLKKFGFEIGYSGHERGGFIPLAAVAMGACVIEKHITFDKNQDGNDHKVSLLPDELIQMVKQIRSTKEAMGHDGERLLTQGELINREVLAKSLYVTKAIFKGDSITRDVIGTKSPGQGLQPNKIEQLIGRVSHRDMKKGSFFFESDLKKALSRKQRYEFSRPYGIPVRYHDFKNMSSQGHLDFVEFHLSYQDLLLSPSDFIHGDQDLFFAVHSPELFEGDHILDLCSSDEAYRQISIDHLQRVVDHCGLIGKCFPEQSPPLLVLNAGGWSKNGFISSTDRQKCYDTLKASLAKVNAESVQIAIQTMPPFPWHFGGQSYHNLFVDPYEISSFCSDTGAKICLDVSHSMMACNYYGWNLSSFVKTVGAHIAYLHIVDALGPDGEGVQMGKGDVNFYELGKILQEVCPDAPFIPEVWQGHTDNGAGFWDGLDFLEKTLG